MQVHADADLLHEISEADRAKLAEQRRHQEASLQETAHRAGIESAGDVPAHAPAITILCATWNLGGQPCIDMSLSAWLSPGEFDLYVVAAQELGSQAQRYAHLVALRMYATASKCRCSSCEPKWRRSNMYIDVSSVHGCRWAAKLKSTFGEGYSIVKQHSKGAAHISIFARYAARLACHVDARFYSCTWLECADVCLC